MLLNGSSQTDILMSELNVLASIKASENFGQAESMLRRSATVSEPQAAKQIQKLAITSKEGEVINEESSAESYYGSETVTDSKSIAADSNIVKSLLETVEIVQKPTKLKIVP